MNEQTPINEPEPLDRREARRQRRQARLADPSYGGNWVAGLILILLGGVFLTRNMGMFDFPLKNWWALFLLMPAIGCLSASVRAYQEAGNRFNTAARASLFIGIMLSFVTIMFLFDISWTFVGPVMIILAGCGILLNYMLGNKE